MAQIYPLGIGLGRTGPAVAKFGAEIQAHWDKYGTSAINPGENYFQVLISETGLPGTITMLILTFAILWRGYKSYLRIEDNDLQWFSVASLSVLVSIFVVFFGGPALVTAPLNMFFWFLSGALLKLPILDQELRQQELKEASG
jgi:O-antigen ligase